jgi:hypothetical protein
MLKMRAALTCLDTLRRPTVFRRPQVSHSRTAWRVQAKWSARLHLAFSRQTVVFIGQAQLAHQDKDLS